MSERKDDLTQSRLDKLQKIRERGIDPYPSRYQQSHTIGQAIDLFLKGEENADALPPVNLAGRITAVRTMGKASFMDIRDGSGKIQLFFGKNNLGEEKYATLSEFDLGDFIGVTGQIFRTRTEEITLRAQDFVILSKALKPLPEKWHGLADVEKRYRQRYLDLITNENVRQIFAVRSKVIAAMRQFLNDRGFMEVETPVLHSQAGGAMAKPFITHHNALDRDLYLRIATELHLKRLIIGGFDRVYEIGRIFRNEGISTKHNPEFTTLESYQAYADYNEVMDTVEAMIPWVAQEVLGKTTVTFNNVEINLAPPWKRITLRQAIKEGSGFDFQDFPDTTSLESKIRESGIPVEPGLSWGKLVDHLLSHSVEPHLMQPTFLIDYPVELSPLAKRKSSESNLVERFEAFAAGMEIANAFSELNDPQDQRSRFEEQEKMRSLFGDEEAERIDEEFLLALEHGMPPTGGLGIGIDRLVMLLTGQQSIREVILFPQLRSKDL